MDEEERLRRKVEVGELLDIYGELLPPRTRELLVRYYEDDLSLAELAAEAGRTRQSVHEHLRRGEARLRAFEDVLGLRKKRERLHALRAAFARLLAQVPPPYHGEGQSLLEELRRLAEGDDVPREAHKTSRVPPPVGPREGARGSVGEKG
ncbi:MAG: Signal recognition particle associated protein [Brockia lithotrophica]|uniref:Signal recognition particle associated protein n=1 Tax=Brockia lithotrophica TaxID=933949 RepID=A0A2T5G927_9BACL|nr:hypothetical protein [Brockia lithotrophica]PTQ52694.1 MAG: Signal recognition particle associated protein [Brockia lithotrophica]